RQSFQLHRTRKEPAHRRVQVEVAIRTAMTGSRLTSPPSESPAWRRILSKLRWIAIVTDQLPSYFVDRHSRMARASSRGAEKRPARVRVARFVRLRDSRIAIAGSPANSQRGTLRAA